MTIASLTAIRSNFEPYIPIRWTVFFEGKGVGLNILGESFPAKEVSFNRITAVHEDIEIAPHVSIPMMQTVLPVIELTLTFYDNNRLEIYKFFNSLFSDIALGVGGFDSDLQLPVWIEEFGNDMEPVSKNGYIIEFDGSWTKLLGQDPTPFELPITFKVVGVLEED